MRGIDHDIAAELAAHRAGLKVCILPRLNEPDLEELPDEVRQTIQFILVDQIDEVLQNALEAVPAAGVSTTPKETAPKRTRKKKSEEGGQDPS